MDILAHFSQLNLRIKEMLYREQIAEEANDAMKTRAEIAEKLLIEAADVLDNYIVVSLTSNEDDDAARHLVRTMRRVGNREPATVNPVIASVAEAHRDVYANRSTDDNGELLAQ